MRFGIVLAAAALVSALTDVPALAQGDVCLRKNRIRSIEVLDGGILVATDMAYNKYTIHMSGICVGLDQFSRNLTFRPITQLGCVNPGDSIGYSLPGEPLAIAIRGFQRRCYVDRVTAGAPEEIPS